MAYPDEVSAIVVAEYLRRDHCPAVIFPVAPGFDFCPRFEVLVRVELLHRARWLWSLARAQLELTDAELDYLATGKLPGEGLEELRRDAAA